MAIMYKYYKQLSVDMQHNAIKLSGFPIKYTVKQQEK